MMTVWVPSLAQDIPCLWKSLTNTNFDLRGLTVVGDRAPSYFIKDGDIPCTPEVEPSYNFVWNFCAAGTGRQERTIFILPSFFHTPNATEPKDAS
jgi:hypothetical protein